MPGYFTKREQIVILIITLIPISLLGFSLVKKELGNRDRFQEQVNNLSSIEERDRLEEDLNMPVDIEPISIMVHISGAIESPGLVYLKEGDRLIDAVEIAGGLKADADVNSINLARRLLDEERIHIPRLGEGDVLPASTSTYSEPTVQGKINSSTTSVVDINNCSREELISLPGIGEVTADKIIEYRENNRFSKKEDIMNVSGIGDKKYQAIKDLIIVR